MVPSLSELVLLAGLAPHGPQLLHNLYMTPYDRGWGLDPALSIYKFHAFIHRGLIILFKYLFCATLFSKKD